LSSRDRADASTLRGLQTVCLLDKKCRREVNFVVDYVGFEIPDEFVVGYGMDFADEYRGLPFVGVLKPEAYAKH
jgi:hypoxanthine phosphoribosyltransferase